MSLGAAIVELKGIGKRFPGVRALHDVSVTIRSGEVHALTGENGSGKSTLSRIMAGVLRPEEGEILVDGQRVSFSGPAEAIASGIVMISQELTLAPTLSVAENIFLGRLPRTRLGLVDWDRLERDAQAVLDRLDVHVSPRTRISTLSVEIRQEVEIARALSSNARVLILDEATSSLSEAATTRLLELIRKERDAGMAVVMITHRMPEIYAVADIATVLRDGRKVDTVPLSQARESDLVRMMVGREISDFYGKRQVPVGEVVLEVEDLGTADGALAPTSFSVRRGEIFGIAGLVGSGKAEVGLALGGAIPATGRIKIGGRAVPLGNPRADRRRHRLRAGRPQGLGAASGAQRAGEFFAGLEPAGHPHGFPRPPPRAPRGSRRLPRLSGGCGVAVGDDLDPVRRQPAESHPRPHLPAEPRRAGAERTDARHRRRCEERNLPHAAGRCRTAGRHHRDLLGAARAARRRRSHRGVLRRPPADHLRPRRGDGGIHRSYRRGRQHACRA